MKKFFGILSIVLIFILSFSSCSINNETVSLSADDKFNFMSYENSGDIRTVEQLDLGGSFSARCMSYKFTYISDNYQVTGYISIPIDCINSKTPYKVIVYNRGGNGSFGMLSDTDTAKICANTNRVVIASNYRGSSGSTGKDEFGGADLNDVIKLIDLCEEFAFADMTDLCVAGVSRGGMMSYLSAKADDRVKRIVAVSSPTDLTEMYNNREDMQDVLKGSIGGAPKDLPEEYEKRSAVHWADEINVPALIIHSKGDNQVPYSQAEKMVEKLKEYHKDYNFISYDDDTHGFHGEDIEIIVKWLNNEDISEYK